MQKEERNETDRFTYCDKIERLIETVNERMAAHERTH